MKEWKGTYIPYDILKEAFVAFLAVAVLIAVLAVVFSSPDEPAVTLKTWSTVDPVDFAQTAVTELDGTSGTATYGPPYNTTPDASQHIGFFEPAQWIGVHQPVDTAQDFVIGPLRTLPNQPVTQLAITAYESAPSAQQTAWTTAYEKAVANATDVRGRLHVPAGHYGPVGVIVGSLTAMAQTGGLDGTLLSNGQFYNTDYTKPLLFLADGTYLADRAGSQHLQGDQWGMMNETGNYPGQAWLWLYTMWYQVPPMNASSNGDLEVWVIMMALSLALLFLPFIPILRSIPRWSRVYRLIWRRHYQDLAHALERICTQASQRLIEPPHHLLSPCVVPQRRHFGVFAGAARGLCRRPAPSSAQATSSPRASSTCTATSSSSGRRRRQAKKPKETLPRYEKAVTLRPMPSAMGPTG